jgi:hypothetical protein
MVNAEDGKNLMLVNNTVVTVYVDEETSEINFTPVGRRYQGGYGNKRGVMDITEKIQKR